MKFELPFAEFIINARIGKETESSNILVEQGLPRPSSSRLQLLTGIDSCAQKWKWRAHCATSKPESNSTHTSLVHRLFQKQRLQLLSTGSSSVWGRTSLPARQCWASPARVDFFLLLFLRCEYYYGFTPCFLMDLELFFFLFPMACWVFTHIIGHSGHKQHHRSERDESV